MATQEARQSFEQMEEESKTMMNLKNEELEKSRQDIFKILLRLKVSES